MVKQLEEYVYDGLSVMAVETKTGKCAGFRVSSKLDRYF